MWLAVFEDFPWAAIGTALMGVGSLLSGWAAYKVAAKKDEPEAREPDR